VVPPRPALVPIRTEAAWVRELQGITIPDVVLRVVAPQADPASKGPGRRRPAPLAVSRGSLLFAHFGLSGPVALDVSQAVTACADNTWPVLECDFLPEVSAARLDEVLETTSGQSGRRRVAGLLEPWLPQRLAEALVAQSQIPADRRIAELSRHERQQLAQSVKGIRVPTAGTLGFDKAEVTAGGVSLSEVDSRTMESKLVPGLFIAGELLDLDGLIGGYNLQAAFSTGYLAGESV
jgi:hypothetical protein